MLEQNRNRYERELLDSVVPFWFRHSIDDKHGGFFSCLDRQGGVYDDRKYIWLQGRAVWTFSRLYNAVERRAEWLEAARRGVEFIEKHAFDPSGRCYFSLTRDGRPLFFQRQPYASVFVVLAFLEYAQATGERHYQHRAEDLFGRIQSWIEFPGMLGRPALDGAQPSSRLTDVMVVLMMALELSGAVHEKRYAGVTQNCIEAAMKHHEPERNLLLEIVAPDGSKHLSAPEGRLFNPGHSIETAWFLLHALRHHPNAQFQKTVLGILEGSLEFGWDEEYGGLFYLIDIEGKPVLNLSGNMKIWWPHTEAIYAVTLAYTLTRDQKWLAWLERLDEYAFGHFSDPGYGEWFGYCDRRGNVTNTCKGNNYKGIYHLARCLLMSVQAIDGVSDDHAPKA